MPVNEHGDMPQGGEEETEDVNVSLDQVFFSLADDMPTVSWILLTKLVGKPDAEAPSEKAQSKMRKGWQTFFKVCGVKYVGKGFNVELKNPLWILLIPIVATVSALMADFGLQEIFQKPKAKPNTEQVN